MAISSNATAITFNDATTQTTAPVNTNANVVAVGVTAPIASSGGTSPTISHAASGVTAGSYTLSSITVNATGHITAASSGSGAAGTVTSVATGNGLSGGTITTSGTLVLACPTFNTVGSYAQVRINGNGNPYTITSGNNYSAGGGTAGVGTAAFPDDFTGFVGTNNLSGTWKWMGSSAGLQYGGWCSVACRVS